MNPRFVSVIALWFLTACTSPLPKPLTVLEAPAGVSPAMATQLDKGNALFAAQKWVEAEQIYRQAIATEPTLAEAHYNLASTLHRAGKAAEAKNITWKQRISLRGIK